MVSVLPPAKLAHVVLRTNNYEEMVEFYQKFLGARISARNPVVAFLTYDEEHHRIAIVNLPHIGKKVDQTNGLEHFAFTYNSLQDLLTAYTQRRELGYKPIWAVNHRLTLSFYYQDPDGNRLEQQADIMNSEEANEFMLTEEFTMNPFGIDVDPEELISRLEAGESEDSLMKPASIGSRDISTLPEAMGTKP